MPGPSAAHQVWILFEETPWAASRYVGLYATPERAMRSNLGHGRWSKVNVDTFETRVDERRSVSFQTEPHLVLRREHVAH